MTSPFAGRLFGPGLPGAGIAATAYWEREGTLVVHAAGTPITAVDVHVAAGGFNAAGLRLSWRDEAGEHLFFIETETACAACLAQAPAPHSTQLKAAAVRRERIERRFRLGLAGLLLLIVLPFGVFFWGQDHVAGWVVDHIPYEQEAQLGDLVLAQTRLQLRLHESGPAVAAVRAVGEQLTSGSAHRYRWFVADHPGINAFAAPGGIVVVHAGLIRSADSAEELAGVLAHEIAHAELRHGLETTVKQLGLRALAAVALGDISGTAVADMAQQLTALRFSRDAEREADREGVRRLVAARINPEGMVRFFEKLAQEELMTPPTLFSTHPATKERLSDLRRETVALGTDWQPLDIDLAAAQAALKP